MPRVARSESPGVVYHVMSRFIDHRFELDDALRADVIQKLGRVFSGVTDWQLIGYAFMSNHWHLLTVAGASRSTSWTRSLNTAVAMRLQRARKTNKVRPLGAVFAQRPNFLSVPRDRVAQVLAYIHLNPVRARVVANARESTWTSHRAIVGIDEAPPWLRVSTALDLCGFQNDSDGGAKLERFVESPEQRQRETLVWNESLLAAGLRAARRIAGASAGLSNPRLEQPEGVSFEFETRKPSAKIRPYDPEPWIAAVAKTVGISVDELTSQRREPRLLDCRKRAIEHWVKAGGRIVDIASALGVHRSTAYALLNGGRGVAEAIRRLQAEREDLAVANSEWEVR